MALDAIFSSLLQVIYKTKLTKQLSVNRFLLTSVFRRSFIQGYTSYILFNYTSVPTYLAIKIFSFFLSFFFQGHVNLQCVNMQVQRENKHFLFFSFEKQNFFLEGNRYFKVTICIIICLQCTICKFKIGHVKDHLLKSSYLRKFYCQIEIQNIRMPQKALTTKKSTCIAAGYH